MNRKIISFFLTINILAIVFIRAYTTDIIPGQNVSPDSSAKIVQDIREKMNDTKVVNVPIQAYIIPSVDAHQVCSTIRYRMKKKTNKVLNHNIFFFFRHFSE